MEKKVIEVNEESLKALLNFVTDAYFKAFDIHLDFMVTRILDNHKGYLENGNKGFIEKAQLVELRSLLELLNMQVARMLYKENKDENKS